jgi:hypothetical protein
MRTDCPVQDAECLVDRTALDRESYCKGAVTETPPPPAGVVSETFPAAATGRAPLIKFSQAFAVENCSMCAWRPLQRASGGLRGPAVSHMSKRAEANVQIGCGGGGGCRDGTV